MYRVLFLGPVNQNITTFLLKKGCYVYQISDNINHDKVVSFKPDLVISYGNFRTINFHISYLPWNRGADPNFWSFYEDTPKGVTIHEVDEGYDTGNIIIQKELFFDDDKKTLAETYEILKQEIENLFIQNWESIKSNNYVSIPQNLDEGSKHYKKDLDCIRGETLPFGWKTSIENLNSKNMIRKRTDLDIIQEIQNVRTKNNVNWMDIIRLAITENPIETKKLLSEINNCDDEISSLFKELSEN